MTVPPPPPPPPPPPRRRPLTPLERALLTAVVELGDEADSVSVRQRADCALRQAGIKWPTVHAMHQRIEALAADGFVQSYLVTDVNTGSGTREMRYWRPACDLTAVLAAAGDETT